MQDTTKGAILNHLYQEFGQNLEKLNSSEQLQLVGQICLRLGRCNETPSYTAKTVEALRMLDSATRKDLQAVLTNLIDNITL